MTEIVFNVFLYCTMISSYSRNTQANRNKYNHTKSTAILNVVTLKATFILALHSPAELRFTCGQRRIKSDLKKPFI